MPTILDHKERVPRSERDYYRTPDLFAARGIDLLRDHIQPQYILDAGAGDGAWGQAVIASGLPSALIGVEINAEQPHPRGYGFWCKADYLTVSPSQVGTPDAVIGNPPYALAEEFVRHSLHLVADGGYVLFLLRLAFLESAKRAKGLFAEYPPLRVVTCDKRPVFYGEKNGITAFAYFIWQKGWSGATTLDWCRMEKR